MGEVRSHALYSATITGKPLQLLHPLRRFLAHALVPPRGPLQLRRSIPAFHRHQTAEYLVRFGARLVCAGDVESVARAGRLVVGGTPCPARLSGGRREAASQSDQEKIPPSRPRLSSHRALPHASRSPEKAAVDKKIR